MGMNMVMITVMVVTLVMSYGGAFTFNNFEVPHHTCLMMFQYMTVVHPAARTIVWDPRNLDLTSRRKIYSILPTYKIRRIAIYLKHLKEKSVKVKRMVHQARV